MGSQPQDTEVTPSSFSLATMLAAWDVNTAGSSE
jgi:hypothetical protein